MISVCVCYSSFIHFSCRNTEHRCTTSSCMTGKLLHCSTKSLRANINMIVDLLSDTKIFSNTKKRNTIYTIKIDMLCHVHVQRCQISANDLRKCHKTDIYLIMFLKVDFSLHASLTMYTGFNWEFLYAVWTVWQCGNTTLK